uniref:Phytanoyl-CoA dioxygenase n=1 Tax=Lotharella oceanica TaxID=641309 RepID=A0A7S2TSC7_9EUKA|mmetsp:Transcript_27768/g.51840  ORF Transcript_27768/g.51840 Transcript_27768/m.51840 type:complete len:214 (+) Transcript_27768:278-919(+)
MHGFGRFVDNPDDDRKLQNERLRRHQEPHVADHGAARFRGGTPHTVYKEKINYKLKGGGGGYLPHQDSYFKLARDGDSKLRKERMLTDEESCVCMIAVDAMSESNGCPYIAPKAHTLGWLAIGGCEPSAPLKGIKSSNASSKIELKWQPVMLDKGDVLIYGNMMPHMSKQNTSQQNRRALFTIYADEQAVGFVQPHPNQHCPHSESKCVARIS